MSDLIRIAVDAMGGDNSPQKVIDGIIHNHNNDKTSFYKIFGDEEKINDCIKNSDAVVILTEWNEFRSLSPQRLKKHMKGNILIDLRNALNPDSFRESGFKLIQVGRPNLISQ